MTRPFNAHSTTPTPGACPVCWQHSRAIPLIRGRCFRCDPMREAETAATILGDDLPDFDLPDAPAAETQKPDTTEIVDLDL